MGRPHSRPPALCLNVEHTAKAPRAGGGGEGAAAGTEWGRGHAPGGPQHFFFLFEILSFQITRLLDGYGSKQRNREMTQLPVEGLWPAGKTFPFLPSSLKDSS